MYIQYYLSSKGSLTLRFYKNSASRGLRIKAATVHTTRNWRVWEPSQNIAPEANKVYDRNLVLRRARNCDSHQQHNIISSKWVPIIRGTSIEYVPSRFPLNPFWVNRIFSKRTTSRVSDISQTLEMVLFEEMRYAYTEFMGNRDGIYSNSAAVASSGEGTSLSFFEIWNSLGTAMTRGTSGANYLKKLATPLPVLIYNKAPLAPRPNRPYSYLAHSLYFIVALHETSVNAT